MLPARYFGGEMTEAQEREFIEAIAKRFLEARLIFATVKPLVEKAIADAVFEYAETGLWPPESMTKPKKG
jgi:hypothetical protein